MLNYFDSLSLCWFCFVCFIFILMLKKLERKKNVYVMLKKTDFTFLSYKQFKYLLINLMLFHFCNSYNRIYLTAHMLLMSAYLMCFNQ